MSSMSVWWYPFTYRSFTLHDVLCTNCWSFYPVLTMFCSEKSFAVPINLKLFPILSSIVSRGSGFVLRSLIHYEMSFMQGDEHLSIISFLVEAFSLACTICWMYCHFSSVSSQLLYQRSGGYSCVNVYLRLPFDSIDWHVCFCANIMLILLL